MAKENGPSRQLSRIGFTEPGVKGIPSALLHGDDTALTVDYEKVNVASPYARQLGRLLTPKIGGEDTRKSILQSNTGGERQGFNKLKTVNHFPYKHEATNHIPPSHWGEYATRLNHYDEHSRRVFAIHPDTYMTVTTPSGLAVAMETDGKIGVIKSVEGMPERLGETPLSDAVQSLVELDTKIVDLMWNHDTAFGHWHKTPEDHGLTLVGRSFLTACAESGIPIFDVSHASVQTARDMIELSNNLAADSLVVATHTGARIGEAAGITRNITDDVAEGIIEQGGLIGIGLTSGMLGGNSMEHVVRAIEHFASLSGGEGINHVALGPDFNGMEKGKEIEGAANVVEVQNLAQALREAGFSEDEIEGIFWRNAYDAFHKILPVAA